MGYLFLSVSLFAGLTKAYCGKKTSGYTQNIKDAVTANVIRMFFCILIGFLVLVTQGNIRFLNLNSNMVAVSAFSGISTAVFVVTWLMCVKNGVYMLVEVFLMLGVLVPLILSSIFLKETIQATDLIGFAVLLIAVTVMCSYNNSQQKKLTVSTFVLLLICGVCYGLTDFSQKLFVTNLSQVPVSVFNFYTYIFAFVLLIPLLFLYKMDRQQSQKSNLKKIIGYILIMSVCLFVNSYFKTKAAYYISSAKLYPLNQASALILSALMSSVFFGEKLTAKCILGLFMAIAGILIINVL